MTTKREQHKLHFDKWAATHQLMTVTFWWKNRDGTGECRLHDKTFNQALEIAKGFGYLEPKWYKPSTWSNGVVTVG